MIQYRGALELCVVSKSGDEEEMKERLKHWLKADIQDLSKIFLWKKTKFKQHTFKNTTATLLEKKNFSSLAQPLPALHCSRHLNTSHW